MTQPQMSRAERIAYTAGMVSHSYHPQDCPYRQPALRAAYEKGRSDGAAQRLSIPPFDGYVPAEHGDGALDIHWDTKLATDPDRPRPKAPPPR